MKSLDTLTNNPYHAYRYLLVQNIINAYNKSQLQDCRKDIQRCFAIDNQKSKVEMSVIQGLVMLLIHYKKSEIKKLFLTFEELITKAVSQECELSKIYTLISEEDYLKAILTRFYLKEILAKKQNLVLGLGLECFITNGVWVRDKHNFILFCYISLGLLLLQKNPSINQMYVGLITEFISRFKEIRVVCNCGKFRYHYI